MASVYSHLYVREPKQSRYKHSIQSFGANSGGKGLILGKMVVSTEEKPESVIYIKTSMFHSVIKSTPSFLLWISVGSWRNSSVSEVLSLQTSGPEFHPQSPDEPLIKTTEGLVACACELSPGAGRQVDELAAGPASI